jgi:predicted deacetylase
LNEFAISIHDVAPHTWAACRRLLDDVCPAGSPITWLVTPHHHRRTRVDADPAFVRALRGRTAAGDEIALHGYFHLDEAARPRTPAAWFERRVLTASEGEFAALSHAEARLRIAHGVEMLSGEGLGPRAFVAPAWLAGSGAMQALRESGLDYTCTRDVLYPLPAGTPIRAPSLVWSTRSAWRRSISRWWNRARLARLGHEPRVRVALHPADAEHPEVLRRWAALVAALADSRRPVLESCWLPSIRA